MSNFQNQLAFSAGQDALRRGVTDRDEAFPEYRAAVTRGEFEPSVSASVCFVAGITGKPFPRDDERVDTFPVTVRMSSAALQELHSCEYGSYEDSFEEGDTRTEEYADGKLHIVEIIERSPHKTVVRLESQDEVDEFFAQAVSGTFGMYHPGVCQRIYDELLPLVSDAVPEWIRKSPRIGY